MLLIFFQMTERIETSMNMVAFLSCEYFPAMFDHIVDFASTRLGGVISYNASMGVANAWLFFWFVPILSVILYKSIQLLNLFHLTKQCISKFSYVRHNLIITPFILNPMNQRDQPSHFKKFVK